MKLENVHKLSLPITIIVASLILGGSLYAVQVNKQRSIEKQQELKLEQQRQEKQELEDKEDAEKQIKVLREIRLNSCLSEAETDYWIFMKLNGTEKEDGSVNALNRFWDSAEKNKQQDVNNCFNQFK